MAKFPLSFGHFEYNKVKWIGANQKESLVSSAKTHVVQFIHTGISFHYPVSCRGSDQAVPFTRPNVYSLFIVPFTKSTSKLWYQCLHFTVGKVWSIHKKRKTKTKKKHKNKNRLTGWMFDNALLYPIRDDVAPFWESC